MKITPTQYTCEICGNTSTDIEVIKKCEEQGIDKPLVNINDVIYFKDYGETEIYSDEYLNDRINGYGTCYLEFYKGIRRRKDTKTVCKLYVCGIEISGHSISYFLSTYKVKNFETKTYLNNFTRIGYKNNTIYCEINEYCSLNYPKIISNEFMQKFLDKQKEYEKEYLEQNK